MPKLLFDGTAMQSDQRATFHGGGEYAKFILRAAILRGYVFDVALNPNLFLDPETMAVIDNSGKKIVHVRTKAELYSVLDSGTFDIFYSALPYKYYDYSSKARFIGVIHGLRPLEIVWGKYKHKYYASSLKRIVGWCIARSSIIKNELRRRQWKKLAQLINIHNSMFITVSNHTKYAILNFFPEIQARRIHVFYSPFDTMQKDNDNKEGTTCAVTPFFLLVSGNRFEKNPYRAIKAFDKLLDNNLLSGFEVVVTGAENLPFADEIKHKDRFKLLPYVTTERLRELYSNAFCFVYPSLNEGFGYPPILAMSVNTPVIASSATSIPEVCGNAALYFSPENMDDLCNRILHIVDDEEKRTELIALGKERVRILQKKQSSDISKYIGLIFDTH